MSHRTSPPTRDRRALHKLKRTLGKPHHSGKTEAALLRKSGVHAAEGGIQEEMRMDTCLDPELVCEVHSPSIIAHGGHWDVTAVGRIASASCRS